MKQKHTTAAFKTHKKRNLQAICEAIESRIMLSAATVTTNAATPVSSTSATLNATVNPNGLATSVSFQYSTDPSFPATNQQSIGSGFYEPHGVAVDAAGDVIVADTQNDHIKQILPDGTVNTIQPDYDQPNGVAVDAAGDIFVTITDNYNVVFKELPDHQNESEIGSGFNVPKGVAVDANGDVFIADTNNNAVKEILSGSNTTQTLGSGFSAPSAVAVDAAGDVFVADTNHNAIKEILANTTTVNTIASGFNNPTGVAVDAAGDVFVADYSNNAVKEILPDGTIHTISNGLSNPLQVAVDAAGDVFVTDTVGSGVTKLTPTSTAASPASLTGTTVTAISGTLTGLVPGTTYYERAVATGPGGIVVGSTRSFTTSRLASTLSLNTIQLPYGIALANSQITGNATYSTTAVPGTFTFTTDAGTVLSAGDHATEAVTFTPTNAVTYASVTGTVDVQVAAATPVLSALSSISLNFGTALANSQLAGSASFTVNGTPVNVPGTFSYTTNAGTVLQPGAGQIESVTFTPTDTTNYTTVATSIVVNVNTSTLISNRPPVIRLSGLQQTYDGSPEFATATTTPANLDVTITYSQNGIAETAPTAAGTYNVTATVNELTDTESSTGTLVIGQATAQVNIGNIKTVFNGHSHSATTNVTASNSADASAIDAMVQTSYRNLETGEVSSTAPLSPGHYDVLATFEGNANYAAIPTFDTGNKIEISPFAKLASPAIFISRHATTLTGKLASKSEIKNGTVTVTLDGVSKTAKVNRFGKFSDKFITSNMAVGTYPIQYTYSSSTGLGVTSWTATLNVTNIVKPTFDTSHHYAPGLTIPVTVKVSSLAGHPIKNASLIGVGIQAVDSLNTVLPLPTGTDAGGVFKFDAESGKYHLSLGTSGLRAGKYILMVGAIGDPIVHAVHFTIK